jgi:hypothetical protein
MDVKTRHGRIYTVPRKRDRRRFRHTPMHRMLNHALDSVERHNNNPQAVKQAKDRYLGIQQQKQKSLTKNTK